MLALWVEAAVSEELFAARLIWNVFVGFGLSAVICLLFPGVSSTRRLVATVILQFTLILLVHGRPS